jgi:hypothetical protein
MQHSTIKTVETQVPDDWFDAVKACGCGERIFLIIKSHASSLLQPLFEFKETQVFRIEFSFDNDAYYFYWDIAGIDHARYIDLSKTKLATDLLDMIVLQGEANE